MKSIFLMVILHTFCVGQLKAQNYLKIIQGKWAGSISTDPESKQKYYGIVKNNKMLSLSVDSTKLISAELSVVGFSKYKNIINESELDTIGLFLCICTKKKELRCSYVSTFNIQEPSYYYGNTDIFEFTKVSSLPTVLYKELLDWDNKNKTNYLTYISSNNTIKQKAVIYSKPHRPTKMYLIKGDEIEIIEEKDGWLRIRFYGKKNIEGWIKKSDVE